jgi:hypothetical protein
VRGPLRWAQNCGKVCNASPHPQRSESRRGPLTLVRYAHSTSPRTRGEVKRALSFSRRSCARGLPTKATNVLPPKNKGRRSAEKAQLSRGASPRSGCRHPYALRARPRVQRNALAFRRSTAVLVRLLPLTQLRAAFPGTAGCKREDPPRRQCSELLADRS